MPEGCNLFGLFLVHIHGFDELDIEQGLTTQRKLRTPIGQLALQSHFLNLKEVMEVLKIQADCIGDSKASQQRFGEIAVKHGFLSEMKLECLLKLQLSQQIKLGEILIDAGILSVEQRDTLLLKFNQLTAGGK